MNPHEYGPKEARELLLRKLEAVNADLAARVRAAMDAGKDVEEEGRPPARGKGVRQYRKAVPLSEEEALQAGSDVLQAYFVEQPLFVSSALDNAHLAVLGNSSEERTQFEKPALRSPETSWDTEKAFAVDLRTDTQLGYRGEDTFQFQRVGERELAAQRGNMSLLRELLTFTVA